MVGTTCTTDPSARWTIAESVVLPVTEPLDLDALKRTVGPHDKLFTVAHQLIAELEATRAELDDQQAATRDCDQAARDWQARAERAEAAIARVEALAHRCTEHYFDDMAADIRAALRGE